MLLGVLLVVVVEARRREEWCGRELTDETFTQKVHRLD